LLAHYAVEVVMDAAGRDTRQGHRIHASPW
jgi:hypothetical protein